MINTWFVFDDSGSAGMWMTDGPVGWSETWSNAKEFHSEEDAVKASKGGTYVVFGWVQ